MIFNAMVEIYKRNPMTRREAAFEEAQTGLPPDRRRKGYYSVVYRYKKWIDGAKTSAKAIRELDAIKAEKPKALQVNAEELANFIAAETAYKEANSSLLEHQRLRDYHDNMVKLEASRIRRFEELFGFNDKQ